MEVVKKDRTDCENRKDIKVLKKLEEKEELTREERLKLTVSAPRCPVVYGLPKVHKEGNPLWLIFRFATALPSYVFDF